MKQHDLTGDGGTTPHETAYGSSGPAAGLTVTLVCHEADLEALRSEWNALAAAHPVANAFLRHEWADAAWHWRSQDATLSLLTVRCGNQELVGLAPFVRTAARESGLTFRRLEFLSVPDTQFADILFSPDYLPAVAVALVRWLKENHRYWDQLTLPRLHAQTPSLTALADALDLADLHWARQNTGVNYAIDLRGTWKDYYRTRSRRLKKGNNLAANRLQRAGKLELTWLRGTDVDTRIRETVSRLSADSWKRVTGTTLDQPGPQAFLKRLFEHGREQGWLSVWLLTLDSEPLAVELQLVYEGVVHGLRSDFREDLGELSPGTYLNWKIIEGLFGHGLDVYYLGPGENPYKRRWTDTGTLLVRLDAWSPNLRGRLLQALRQRLRPALRRSRDRLVRMLRFASISRSSPTSL